MPETPARSGSRAKRVMFSQESDRDITSNWIDTLFERSWLRTPDPTRRSPGSEAALSHAGCDICELLPSVFDCAVLKIGIPAPGADCSPCMASLNRCATGPCALPFVGIPVPRLRG